jgi:hypothetical protein
MKKERIDILLVLLEAVERFLTEVEQVELNGKLLQKAKDLKSAVEQPKKVLEQEAKGK